MNYKSIEELKLDLIEIQAYRALENEAFCFDGINTIKKEDNISMDDYYEIIENSILKQLENLENNNSKKLILKRK